MFNTKALELVLYALVIFNLLLSPYTKVEESFNIQAVHDILNYGIYPREVLQNYDHMEFPGVVPRTFFGSLIIAGCVKMVDFIYSLFKGVSFLTDLEQGQFHVQIIARAVLGVANVATIVALRKSLDAFLPKSRSKSLGFFYALMFLSQFHILFYATRTLPNFVVLPFVNYALSKIVVGDMSGLAWLAFSGIIFRLEVVVFAGVIAAVSSLIFGQSSFTQNGIFLLVASAVGLLVSFNIDSYFWGDYVVPEFTAFKFNVVEGKSAEWGTEPYFAYFSKYIVNFFRPPHVILLFPFGLISQPARMGSSEGKKKKPASNNTPINTLPVLGISALLYMAIMSFQPHKEWRFIVYTIPIFNAIAGNGLAHLWSSRGKLIGRILLYYIIIISMLISFVLSWYMSFVSSFNYPGGQAIKWVNEYVSARDGRKEVVHMEVPACMTGITRFTQFHDGRIVYDKTENENRLAAIWNDVSILITDKDLSTPQALENLIYNPSNWEEISQVSAFASVRGIGFVRDLINLMNSPEARNELVRAIFNELKESRFDTLWSFLQKSIVLRTFLRVYKRIGQDVMSEMPRKSIQYVDTKNVLNQVKSVPIADLDPSEIQYELNQEVDQLERRLDDEL